MQGLVRDYIESWPDLEAFLFPAEGGGMLSDLRVGFGNAQGAAGIEKHVAC